MVKKLSDKLEWIDVVDPDHEEIQRVASQYINPASLAIVIVGDRKNIEPSLKAVNAGPIVLRDFFGQPITP